MVDKILPLCYRKKMAILCKSWWAALCLSAAVLFFTQTAFCFAEDARIVACETSSYQTTFQNGKNPGSKTPATANNHCCCHCVSHSSLITSASTGVFIGDMLVGLFFDTDDFIPDVPVREIDYPPQLS